MGNKASHRENKIKTQIFHSPEGSVTSLTIPSLCQEPSHKLSMKKSVTTTSSESFNWSRMQSFCLQQEHLTEEHLTAPVLKVATQVLEMFKKYIANVCFDLQSGRTTMHEVITDRFSSYVSSKNVNPTLTTNSTTITRKITVHLITTLYVHDLILNYFENNNKEQAIELLKQVAISHALMGVTPIEFRMIDWFVIRYLTKSKIATEDNINNLIVYFTAISNYLANVYKSQSVRQSMMLKLTTEKTDDRNNNARENYRLMKKWKKQLQGFQAQEEYVERLLNQLNVSKGDDTDSVNTLTLMQNDCIMKHFVPKRKIE